MYHTDKSEIFIKKGTPFVQYIPFKRIDFKIDVHESTEYERKLFRNYNLNFQTSFREIKTYIKLKNKKENNE